MYLTVCNNSARPVVAQGASVTVNATGCVFDPTQGNEIFIYIYIIFSSVWCRGKARR